MQAIVKDAEVHAYVTRNGGTAELTDSNGVETTFTQGIGYREYTATPADGWVWKGWTYEQLYQGEDLGKSKMLSLKYIHLLSLFDFCH